MTTAKEFTLSEQHQKIWHTLRTMKDGERILGADLRKIAGISDIRVFYKIVEDLREIGIFVGANRFTPKGYYEIRTGNDMERFLTIKRTELSGEWAALDRLEKKWNLKQSKEEATQ